jgi:hypothetical protein
LNTIAKKFLNVGKVDINNETMQAYVRSGDPVLLSIVAKYSIYDSILLYKLFYHTISYHEGYQQETQTYKGSRQISLLDFLKNLASIYNTSIGSYLNDSPSSISAAFLSSINLSLPSLKYGHKFDIIQLPEPGIYFSIYKFNITYYCIQCLLDHLTTDPESETIEDAVDLWIADIFNQLLSSGYDMLSMATMIYDLYTYVSPRIQAIAKSRLISECKRLSLSIVAINTTEIWVTSKSSPMELIDLGLMYLNEYYDRLVVITSSSMIWVQSDILDTQISFDKLSLADARADIEQAANEELAAEAEIPHIEQLREINTKFTYKGMAEICRIKFTYGKQFVEDSVMCLPDIEQMLETYSRTIEQLKRGKVPLDQLKMSQRVKAATSYKADSENADLAKQYSETYHKEIVTWVTVDYIRTTEGNCIWSRYAGQPIDIDYYVDKISGYYLKLSTLKVYSI